MRWSIAWPGLLALAASACEHPMVNARLAGPPPAQPASVSAAVSMGEGEQAVLAHRTLQALLREYTPAPGGSAFESPGTSRPAGRAAPSWLQSQSDLLRALADRSRAAALALDHPDGHR
jgi:hypothetical protein